MKIKIIKGDAWYRNRVGEVFEVKEYSDTLWDVVNQKSDEEDGGIRKVDCEVVTDKPKFAIGSKVLITQPHHRFDGKHGIIIAPHFSSTFPWRVEVDGDDDVFQEKYMEPVEEQCTPTDKQWFTKTEALHMALDGAKVTIESAEYPESHLFFDDDKGFQWYYGSTGETGMYDGHLSFTKWKLWTPTPKFTVADFVVDDDGDYGRVVSMEYKDGQWQYELSANVDNEWTWECAEGCLEAV